MTSFSGNFRFDGQNDHEDALADIANLNGLITPHAHHLTKDFSDLPQDAGRARELLAGMISHPDQLDRYGDPFFQKELIRLLLSQDRWSEAQDVARVPNKGRDGWPSIHFARVLDKQNRRQEAKRYWLDFLRNHPDHSEALSAITKSSVDVSEPFLSILKKVPKQRFTTIFDVGANEGQSCTEYRKCFPDARILAFEPVPQTFLKLQAKVGGQSRIDVHNLALGEAEGYIPMSAQGTSTMNRVVLPNDPNSILVPATTVAKFCEEHGINNIDLLKIDTEGHDLAVLKGCDNFLQKISFIQCEASANEYNKFHNAFGDIFQFLTAKGFYLFDIQGFTYEWMNGGYPVLRRFDPIFINSTVVGEMKNVLSA